MMALAGLWSLFNLVVLVLLVVLAIFGIQALRKYLKTPAALPAAGGVSLGARLCRQRQARGMTVESVAQSLGITPQEVEAWEKDTADPTDQQLMDLAALYGGTLADLFVCSIYIVGSRWFSTGWSTGRASAPGRTTAAGTGTGSTGTWR